MNALVAPARPDLLMNQLVDQRVFVACRVEPKPGGGTNKIPCDPFTRANISGVDPANWLYPYQLRDMQPDLYVGLVLSEQVRVFCVDLDEAWDAATGQWSPFSLKVLAMFPGAYVELSHSGTGLHIEAMHDGTLPPHRTRKSTVPGLEVYTRERFILQTGTLAQGNVMLDHTAALKQLLAEYFPAASARTGDEWTTEAAPDYDGPADDAQLVEQLKNGRYASAKKRFGASFTDVWEGTAKGRTAHNEDDSALDMSLASTLAFATGKNCERVLTIMRDAPIARDKWEREDYLRRTILRAVHTTPDYPGSDGKPVTSNQPVPATAAMALAPGEFMDAKKAPLVAARAFLKLETLPALKCWKKEFVQYREGIYVPVSQQAVRAKLYGFLEAMGETPTRDKVSNVADALMSAAHLDDATQVPSWLNDPTRKIPGLIICKNGAYDLDTDTRYDLTPALFSFNALPVEYDPAARAPNWLKFLDSLWHEDPESIAALQEICGLLLTPLTLFQKMFLLCGPRRSGKGTILRVMRELLGGGDNVVSPTLGSLGREFGLQPLIGKLAAFVGDVRLSDRVDQSTLVERLLSITGEDNISVPRKHTTDYDAKLAVRFVFSSNEIPRLADASGSAASRFIVLALTQSFYGREDLTLTERLLGELPGILAWCVEGRRRLMKRGHFVQPESARQQIQQLEELGSPVTVFVREHCTVAPDRQVPVDVLVKAWGTWCAQNNHRPGDSQLFGRNLRAAVPAVTVRRPRTETGGRERVYDGIALTDAPSPVVDAAIKVGFGHGPHPTGMRVPPPA